MTVLIGDQHGVVFFGPTANPKAVRWWAERGQLHWEDSRDNGYGTVSIKDFLLRLQGISDMTSNGKRKANEGFLHVEELVRHQRFIEEALQLVRKAKDQGDPDDPRTRKEMKQRRPITTVVPAAVVPGMEF
jgi:hypothetical protein